jgi:trimeric autotransporter adhesin
MKNFLFALFIICLCKPSIAQSVAINNTGATAHSSSIMDVSNTNKGILIPRMSRTEKNSIATPANGLLIFQNAPDSIGFHYYDGTQWIWLLGSNVADTLSWKRAGNLGTNPTVNFLGTTDNQPLQLRLNNTWAGTLNAANRNYGIGRSSIRNITSGKDNIGLGDSAAVVNSSGSGIIAIGTKSLVSNTTGTGNIAIGRSTLSSTISSTGQIAIGDSAGYRLNSSFVNGAIFIGDKAGYNYLGSNGGFRNVIIGDRAGDSSLGAWTTIIGNLAGRRNLAVGNTFIGSSAGENNTTGENTFIGDNAGVYNTIGNNNTAVGRYTLSNFSVGNSNNNSLLGSRAGLNLTNANNNTAIGAESLSFLTQGVSNTAVGAYSLRFLASNSSYNVAIGDSAAKSLSIGSNNTVVGTWAFRDHNNGNRNTVVGNFAMAEEANGNDNTAIGEGSLWNNNSSFNSALGKHAGFTNNTGSNNSFFGAHSDALLSNSNNATAIGFRARVDTSDAIVLGAIYNLNGYFSNNTNVGIGVTKPYKATLNVARNTLNGTTLGIFGEGQAGLSFQQNFPTIGFNQYRDNSASNTAKFMSNGYSANQYFDDINGSMIWNMSTFSGTQNANSDEANKMILTRNSFLGLGNVGGNPRAYLHIENAIANRKIVMWESANNDNDYFGFGINAGTLRYNVPTAGGGNVHRFFAGPNILFTIFDNGNATLAGTLTQLSDTRLKKNIQPLQNVLSNISQLNGYSYYWKDDTKDTQQQIGVLAQEIKKIYPQLVKQDEKGTLSVNYSGLTPILLESIKELNKKVDAQQLQINELKLLIEKKLK